MSGENEPSAAPAAAADFFKALAQALAVVALYKSSHPITAAALAAAAQALERLFAALGGPEATFACPEGRWVVNGQPLPAGAQAAEPLARAFKARDLHAVTLLEGLDAAGIAALCELLSSTLAVLPAAAAEEFLAGRGVSRVRLNAVKFSAGEAGLAAPSGESSLVERLSGQSLGGYIKTLVEESVDDPLERARIYADILRMVETALERRTRQLKEEKVKILKERVRAEGVMASMGEGRVVVDKAGKVLSMDPVAEQIMGKRFAEVAGQSLVQHAHETQHMVTLGPLGETEEPHRAAATDVSGDDEILGMMRRSTAVIQDENGRLVGTFAMPPYIAELRETVRLKEEFISHVSHQLKAPLASICSALEVLSSRSTGKLDGTETRFLELSLKNARDLSQMISEVLDFSKLGSGRMTVKPEPVPVGELLAESADGLAAWAKAKRLVLKADLTSWTQEATVVADRPRIVQILASLISNAIKFTPPNGRITVSAEAGTGERAGRAVFCVKDTGCGIAPEHQAAVFRRFTQVPAMDGGKREGVGLGLAIVREVVAKHHGEVWLESQLDKGSSFYFTLPLAE